MPNVSTYIRTEDLSKYLEIVKEKGAWTEFIHNALNIESIVKLGVSEKDSVSMSVTSRSISSSKPIKTKEDVIPAIKKVFPEAKFEPLYRDKKNKKL